MYCYKCGKKIPDDAKFCPYCGAEVKKPDEVVVREDGKGGLVIDAPEGSTVTISDEITVREDGKGGLIFDVPEGTTVTISDPEKEE
ncbi:MAG: zinc-ribbon domain-containing protein [Erysipelotrichaceae bacterium]|nr:zinc-ribbon domain-containing protein [Erysipelotrichaceae bacterium]MBQ1522984.1 zinc-ribbon domain-containing protein [Erysipelotrichaceae bacterium]